MTATPDDVGLAEILLANGWRHENIAAVLDIGVEEFRRDYADAIATRGARALETLKGVMYRAAVEGDVEAIDLLKLMHSRDPDGWPKLRDIRRQ